MPEPTPVSGIGPELGRGAAAGRDLHDGGPALARTSMIAEDSSMVTGWRAETVAPTGDELDWVCCS
jgi:hypothetical protein